MPKEIKVRKWVFSDPAENSNKFWNVHYYNDGTWRSHYGRVGTSGAWGGYKPQYKLAAKIREKEIKKKYKEIQQASSEDEHAFMTAVGAISLEKIREAFKISERIIELDYASEESKRLYPQYMQILPINIGMKSQAWKIHNQIKWRHSKLAKVIEAADADTSADLFKSLIDDFFSEMED